MRIGYNPLVNFFHIESELLVFEDFKANMFAQRNGGNVILDTDNVSPIMTRINRPLWVVGAGTALFRNGCLRIPIGNVIPQEVYTQGILVGQYWRFNFQFAGAPIVNDCQIRFWYQDVNNFIYVLLDCVGSSISLMSQQGGGPIGIIAPAVNVWDGEPHYVEVTYNGVSAWGLYLDGVLIGVGVDVFAPQENRIDIYNTSERAIDFWLLKVQNVSPI